MKLQHYFMLLAIVLLLSCKNEKKPQSRWAHIPIPEAKIIPDTLTIHGNLRIDNYFWMRLSDEQKNVESQDAQTQDDGIYKC